MKRMAVLVLALGVFALVGGQALMAAKPEGGPPKPADVPVGWELQFTFKNPRPIQVAVSGRDKPVTFWYMLYTVTNESSGEQIFVPDIVLYTDTGQIIRAGKGVPTNVFDAIQKMYSNPLLKDQTGIAGTILRGKDHAKDGVAIFTDIDPEAGSFDVFVGGICGETTVVTVPNPVPVTVYKKDGKRATEPRDKITLAKTLELHFALPGEAAARFSAPVALTGQSWVMR